MAEALLIRRGLWPSAAGGLCEMHNVLFHPDEGKAHIDTDETIPLFGANGHTRLPMYKVWCSECNGPIVAGTGHRPNGLQVTNPYHPSWQKRLKALAQACLERIQPSWVITGMAMGWDQALAKAAIQLNVPLVAAIPFVGQEKDWHADNRKRYHQILEHAASTVVVNQGPYSTWAYQRRNEWMVDRCTYLLVLWSGIQRGGTYNCVKYAKDLPQMNVWKSWEKYR